MPDFYDYDMVFTIRSGGQESYALRRNTKRLGLGKFCHIEVRGRDGVASYIRTTQWGSKHGRRIAWFNDLDLAMRSGVEWAIRRAKEDAR